MFDDVGVLGIGLTNWPVSVTAPPVDSTRYPSPPFDSYRAWGTAKTSTMKSSARGLVVLLFCLVPSANAADAAELRKAPGAVIELFTSQGCPFSPVADRVFADLERRENIIALSYHVDYWDYVGWKDTFASRANSDLQRDYASLWGFGKLYTPQLVIGGSTGTLGSDVPAAVATIQNNGLTRSVDLVASGDTLQVVVAQDNEAQRSTVWLVTYMEQATVAIGSGENAGKSLTYDHIVTGRISLESLAAGTGTQIGLSISKMITQPSTGLAILVQEDIGGLLGKITGANSYEK